MAYTFLFFECVGIYIRYNLDISCCAGFSISRVYNHKFRKLILRTQLVGIKASAIFKLVTRA